jgi:hypothetical protein
LHRIFLKNSKKKKAKNKILPKSGQLAHIDSHKEEQKKQK